MRRSLSVFQNYLSLLHIDEVLRAKGRGSGWSCAQQSWGRQFQPTIPPIGSSLTRLAIAFCIVRHTIYRNEPSRERGHKSRGLDGRRQVFLRSTPQCSAAREPDTSPDRKR